MKIDKLNNETIPKNETDVQGLTRIYPSQGAVYRDKGYCVNPAAKILKAEGCHDVTIKKNNMVDQNLKN